MNLSRDRLSTVDKHTKIQQNSVWIHIKIEIYKYGASSYSNTLMDFQAEDREILYCQSNPTEF